jgi:hypothetical protein
MPAISASKQSQKNSDGFIRGAERKKIELNYWKEQARNRMTNEEVKNSYNEIDSILIDSGYSI